MTRTSIRADSKELQSPQRTRLSPSSSCARSLLGMRGLLYAPARGRSTLPGLAGCCLPSALLNYRHSRFSAHCIHLPVAIRTLPYLHTFRSHAARPRRALPQRRGRPTTPPTSPTLPSTISSVIIRQIHSAKRAMPSGLPRCCMRRLDHLAPSLPYAHIAEAAAGCPDGGLSQVEALVLLEMSSRASV